MDFSYIKFLLYINKKEHVSKSELCKQFNITPSDAFKIFTYLKDNDYIVYASDTSCRSTYKGQHIIRVLFVNWLLKNFLSIIAIIISIIALFKQNSN